MPPAGGEHGVTTVNLTGPLWHHIDMHGIGPDELVFSYSHLVSAPLPVTPLADIATTGQTIRAAATSPGSLSAPAFASTSTSRPMASW